MQHDNGTIRIQGIYSRTGAGRRALAFPIEEIYTPLCTSAPSAPTAPDSAGGPHEPWGRFGMRERVPLTDLLSRERRLLVVGQPGGGKTTFLKLIAALLARDALHADDPRWTPQRTEHLGLPVDAPPPLPVFVRLSALAARMRTDGAKHPEDGGSHRWLLRALPEEARDVLAARLDEGRCALLLDGLDEVTEPALRDRIVALVAAVLHRWGRNLVVVTSRPHGYEAVEALRGVRAVHVDDFEEDDIRAFLARWTAGLDADLAAAERASRAELEAAVVGVPHIRRMARNPVMLTCLCVIHWNEKALPEGKANLLAAVLRWLLAAREPSRKERGYTSRFAERCFRELALAMTTGQDHEADGKIATADLSWAAERLAGPFRDERGIDDPDAVRREGIEFLEAELLWSGIVEKAGEGQLRFWHLTFQEHYAARALVDRSDEAWWAVAKDHLHDRPWTEVLDHLAGCLATVGDREPRLLIERILRTAPPADLRETARVVGVLGRLLHILRVYDFVPPKQLGWEEARERVLAIFGPEGAHVPAAQRIAAAEALGFDDPRIQRLAPPTAPIPGLDGPALAIYPVTVLEYGRFVQNDGYRDDTWWAGDWTLKQEQGWAAPEDWDAQQATPNRPVVGVSWHEATAFCRWLSAVTRPGWRLPTEAEWEAAATNPAGPYPWGAAEPDAERANFGGNVAAATPVGVYPAGAGPGGHLDLAGNVWEWCAVDLSAELGMPARALRGGGWWDDAGSLRSARRGRSAALDRAGDVGFRVLLSPPSTGT